MYGKVFQELSRDIMKKPNFLIVGAAKCGTSSMAAYLGQHPDIYISPEKECHYFSGFIYQESDRRPWDFYLKSKWVPDYEHYLSRHFTGVRDEMIIGEASTEYLYYCDKTIPQIIEKLGKSTSILIMLRDPVQSSFSRYKHSVRRGWETKKYEDAIGMWESRKQQGYIWDFDYIGAFKYADQVKAYMESFSNVKVVILEEFIRNREGTYRDILAFLGVDTNFNASLDDEYNSSIITELPVWLRYIWSPRLRRLLCQMLPSSIYKSIEHYLQRMVDDRSSHVPVMLPKTRENMRNIFRHDIGRLEALLGRKLTCWYSE